MEVATANRSAHEFFNAGLDDRAASASDLVDLHIVDIDSPYLVTL